VIFCVLVTGGAMFRQQTKPRAGVAKNFCDGNSLFVTTNIVRIL